MSFVTVVPPLVPPTLEVKSAVLPNGHLMTPHDQRRRAALLADSPELSTRPPLNAGNLGGFVTFDFIYKNPYFLGPKIQIVLWNMEFEFFPFSLFLFCASKSEFLSCVRRRKWERSGCIARSSHSDVEYRELKFDDKFLRRPGPTSQLRLWSGAWDLYWRRHRS